MNGIVEHASSSSVSNASRGAVAKLEGGSADSEEAVSAEPVLMPCETETVLVIPLLDGGCSTDPPGFLSEEHVLTRSRQQGRYSVLS